MGFPRQQCWSGLPFPFSRGSSRPRDRTCVSCLASGFHCNSQNSCPCFQEAIGGGGLVSLTSQCTCCAALPRRVKECTPVPSSLLSSPAPVVSEVAVVTALITSGSYTTALQEVPSCFLRKMLPGVAQCTACSWPHGTPWKSFQLHTGSQVPCLLKEPPFSVFYY